MSMKALFPIFAALLIGVAMAAHPAAAKPKHDSQQYHTYDKGPGGYEKSHGRPGKGYGKGHNGFYRHGGYGVHSNVYIVPFADYRRFVQYNGYHAIHGNKFRKFVHRTGRPVAFPRWHYLQTHNSYGYGIHHGQPRWVYVNLTTGRVWQ